MSDSDFALGQSVVVFGTEDSEHRKFLGKLWKISIRRKLEAPVHGIVVRRYWTSQGRVHPSVSDGWEGEQGYLVPLRKRLIYEVAFNIHRKPLKCSSRQMEPRP